MSLNQKQVEFSQCLGEFLVWCAENDVQVIVAEVYRPPETAKLYEEQGKGIANSLHTKKLAADIFRYLGGTVTWDVEAYRVMGEKWKSMHPDNRWGGDFTTLDAVHFSREHEGVK